MTENLKSKYEAEFQEWVIVLWQALEKQETAFGNDREPAQKEVDKVMAKINNILDRYSLEKAGQGTRNFTNNEAT